MFPSCVGSSVGAYTIYSIKSNKVVLAMIYKKVNLIVSTGCALTNIKLITSFDEEFSSIQNGMNILLDIDSPNPIHFQ